MSESTFVEGPSVTAPAALLSWFQGEGAGKRVRVPVVVTPSPLGLAAGYIAASAAVPEAQGLSLQLDDGTLGVSLADRIRSDCEFDVPCAIWIEGVWGSSLGLPSVGGPLAGFGPPRHPFSVRDYTGKVEGEASAILVLR